MHTGKIMQRHFMPAPPALRRILARVKAPRLMTCRRGATALEFALISPIIIFMMLGTIELGVIMYLQNVMESATSNSSRLGKTGYTANNASRQQTILNDLNSRLGNLINTDLVTFSTLSYASFNQIGTAEQYEDTNANGSHDVGEPFTDSNGNNQWDEDMGTQGFGNAGDVVVYTVSYGWPIMTPFMSQVLGTNGVYTISSRSVVRNEPYNQLQ